MKKISCSRRFHQAFSLVELLLVVGVIAILLGLGAPALVGIIQGQGMKRAVNEVSQLVDVARLEAMSMSTWVWLGFDQREVDGRQELVAVIVASKDGTRSLAPGNLKAITRPIRIPDVKVLDSLTSWGATGSGTTVPLSGSSFAFSETVGGDSRDFSGTVLAFNSRGEAALDDSATPSWIEIGLREMRGDVEVPERTASIRVSGFSGQQLVDY